MGSENNMVAVPTLNPRVQQFVGNIYAVWRANIGTARLASPQPDAQQGEGQDRKFAFRNGQFVNRVSGEAIPLEEPVIIFRARDRHAHELLREYLTMVEDEHHRQAIRDRMSEFAEFARQHPQRMKEPGITHDIRHNDATPLAAATQPAVPQEGERLRDVVRNLTTSLDELLTPLERASAEMVAHGKPLNEAGEAAFDRARAAIAAGLAALTGSGENGEQGA